MLSAEAIQEFLGKPVAVQLRAPAVMIDNDGQPKHCVDVAGHTYGLPLIVSDEQGRLGTQLVVLGVLRKSADDSVLVIKTKGDHGAIVLMTLGLADIQHVFLVDKPGEAPGMIQVPR